MTNDENSKSNTLRFLNEYEFKMPSQEELTVQNVPECFAKMKSSVSALERDLERPSTNSPALTAELDRIRRAIVHLAEVIDFIQDRR